MTDDLRARVLAAVLDVRLNLGPNAVALASRGEPVRLAGGEADALTGAVMSVLDEAFPPRFVEEDWNPERLAELAAVLEAAANRPQKFTILPPDAVMIRRRTPEQRHRYLVEHRDEALANGIPGDLIDMLIQETEDPNA